MAYLTKAERKARKLAGLCVTPWCASPAEPGRVKCRACLDDAKKREAAYRAELAAQGLCRGRCGRTVLEGNPLCAECAEIKAALGRKRRRARARQNLCQTCNAVAEEGKLRCRICLDLDTARNRSRKAELVAVGMCRNACGSPSAEGRTRCPACLEAHNLYTRARMRARSDHNLCERCGIAAVASETMCAMCLAKVNIRTTRLQQQRRAQGLCALCGSPSGGTSRCQRCKERRRLHYRVRASVRRQVTRRQAIAKPSSQGVDPIV
jgi:hypothetical protein